MWPLAPRPQVVRGFEPAEAPWGPGHRGVDLLGAVDQPVLAAGSGVVTFAGMVAGRGVVTVSHARTGEARLRTTYEPVEATVRVGDRVGAGDSIGLLRPAMSHCAPQACLHWGLREGSSYLDPLGLLGLGRPRLLPLGP